MPRSKLGIKRQKPIAASIVEAANLVINGRLTLRKASKQFGISKSTLSRHIIKHKKKENYEDEDFKYEVKYDTQKIFDHVQEKEITKYLQTAANMHYGLTVKEVRQLAFN